MGWERPTGAPPQSSPDATMAGYELQQKAVPAEQEPLPEVDDTELIETTARSRPDRMSRLVMVLGAPLCFAVLVVVVVCVFVVSANSVRPDGVPATTSTTLPVPSAQPTTMTPSVVVPPPPPAAPVLPPSAPTPAPPLDTAAPEPPGQAAETPASTPESPAKPKPKITIGPGVRDKVHDLFPRLFP